MQVVMTNNFNVESVAFEFNNELIAKAFLHWLWEHTLNNFTGLPCWQIDESLTFHEDEYAKITFVDGDHIKIELVWNVEVPKEFYKVISRYLP